MVGFFLLEVDNYGVIYLVAYDLRTYEYPLEYWIAKGPLSRSSSSLMANNLFTY